MNSCVAKAKAANIKKTDGERRAFCEGTCITPVNASPAMRKCKGK